MRFPDLVLVSVPVSPGCRHLPTQLAGAGSVVVDEVVQRHVGEGHLLGVRYYQGSLYVCHNKLWGGGGELAGLGLTWVQVVLLDLHLERGGQGRLGGGQGLQQPRLQLDLRSRRAGGRAEVKCLNGQSSVVHQGRRGRHQGGGGGLRGGGGRGGGGEGWWWWSVKDMNHIWFTGDMRHTWNVIWGFSWG